MASCMCTGGCKATGKCNVLWASDGIGISGIPLDMQNISIGKAEGVYNPNIGGGSPIPSYPSQLFGGIQQPLVERLLDSILSLFKGHVLIQSTTFPQCFMSHRA
jgi:hypothetical protein